MGEVYVHTCLTLTLALLCGFGHLYINRLAICPIQAEALFVIVEFGLGFLEFLPSVMKTSYPFSLGSRMRRHEI